MRTILPVLIVLFFSARTFAADDPGARLCMALMAVKIHDTHDAVMAGEQAYQFQNAVQSAGLSSADNARELGGEFSVPIPVMGKALTFGARGNSSSGNASSTAQSAASSASGAGGAGGYAATHDSQVDSAIGSVIAQCNARYFATLRDRRYAELDVTSVSPGEYLIYIIGHMGQFASDHLVVSEFAAVGGGITCLRGDGHEIHTPIKASNNVIAVSCTKNERSRAAVAVVTNAGPTGTVTLPGRDDRCCVPPPTDGGAEKRFLEWSPTAPSGVAASPLPCSCAYHQRRNDQGELEIRNDCDSALGLILLKQPASWPTGPAGHVEGSPAQGRFFAMAVIPRQETVFVHATSADRVMPAFTSCPDNGGAKR